MLYLLALGRKYQKKDEVVVLDVSDTSGNIADVFVHYIIMYLHDLSLDW